MTLSDDELRAHLERRAATAPAADLAEAARVATATPPSERTRTRLQGVAAASAAASIVLAVALIGSALVRDATVASQSPGPSSIAVGTPAATATVAEPWKGLLWRAVESEAFKSSGSTIVMDGVADGDGFLAIGYTIDGNSTTGRIWRSPDGRSWSLVGGEFETAQFERVLPFRDGFLIIGRTNLTADRTTGESRQAVWWSEDGSTWADHTPEVDGSMNPWSAAAGPDELLISGSDQVGHTYWLRSDADFNWTRVDADWPADVRIFGVAGARGGWLAFGATGAGGATTIRPGGTQGAVWSSRDAANWTAAAVDQPGGRIHAISQVGGRFVALGSDSSLPCEGCLGSLPSAEPVVTWVSLDGLSWRRTGQIEPSSNRFGSDPQVSSDASRLLALNLATTGQPLIRQSLDGEVWSELPLLDANVSAFGGLRVFPDVRTPMILGIHGVVAFAEEPFDTDATASRFLPQFGAAAKILPDGLRPFDPRPEEIIPNDVTCPNQEPCGP